MIRIICFCLVAIMYLPAMTQTIRFTDEHGKVYLVDSMSKVPERYKRIAERLPDDPQIAFLAAEIREFLSVRNFRGIRKAQLAYVYDDPWVYGFAGALLVILIGLFFFGSWMSRLSFALMGLMVCLVFHTIWITPHVQRQLHAFDVALTGELRRAGYPEPELADSMAMARMVKEPASLKPWRIHVQVWKTVQSMKSRMEQ